MRILSNNVITNNEIIVFDQIAGGDIVFYYRLPTYTERIKYANKLYQQIEGVVQIVPETRVEFGLLIITGFNSDLWEDENGNKIITDPEDENYNKDWKNFLEISAPEVVAQIAQHIFENSYVKKSGKSKTGVPVEVKKGVEPDFIVKK